MGETGIEGTGQTALSSANKDVNAGNAEQASYAGAKADDEHWGKRGREVIMRIPVCVRIVLGAARMPVSKLMSLTRGSVIPLDRKVSDLVDIVVNDRLVARGEIVVVDTDGERFAVAVREVVHASEN